MKKNLLFDFNIIAYSSISENLKAGIYNVEYSIINNFIKMYGNKYNFYACSDCNEKYFNNLLKNYPEFSCVKYLNAFSKKTYLRNSIKFKINKIRKSKKISLKLIILFLKLIRFFLYFMPSFKHDNKVDIYLSTSNYMPKEILKNNNIKKFFLIYDALSISHPEYFAKNKFKQKKAKKKFLDLYRSLSNNVFLLYDSINAKEETIKYVPELENNKNKVIFLAADKNKYFKLNDIDNKILEKYKIPVNKKYILSLSSLNIRKNLSFIIDSYIKFLEINKDVDDLYLVLAGPNGWMFDGMLKSIENSGLYRNKIILTGFINEEDINTVYNGAFCFVYASLLEGFGLPILEAMQCGLPVISSNTTSMPEVYGDAAIGIDPTKNEELIKAISDLYYNENYRKEITKKCLERSKVFSWEEIVRNIECEM